MRPRRRPRSGGRLARLMLQLGVPLAILLRPLGVDRARFLALLEVRLLEDLGRGRRNADERRPGVFSGGMVMTLVLHLLLGAFLAFAILRIREPMVGLTLTLGVVMVFVTMTLMSEHAGTLFDTTDLDVLGPLPVGGRTVLAARVAHTLIYFALLVGSLGLLPLIVGAVRFGPWPFAPSFVLALILGTATCFGLALTLLVLVLRVFPSARVRSALLFVQIGGAVAGIASFQVLPLLHRMPTAWLLAPDSWWPWFVPPAHGAALVVATMDGPAQPPAGLVVLAFLLPGALLGAIALASARFQGQLAAMASADRGSRRPRRPWLRDLLVHDLEARAGYEFLAALTARERQFRMRVWPMIALAWFLAGWGVLQSSRRGGETETGMACMALYVVGLSLPQVLLFTRFSDDWQARWLFRTLPLQSPARFVHGATMALAARFVLPATLLTLAVVLAVGGPAILVDALYAMLVIAMLWLIVVLSAERRMPFTRKFHASELSGNLGRSLVFVTIAGVFAMLHVKVRGHPPLFAGLLGAVAVGVVLLAWAYVRSVRGRREVPLDWGDERAEAGARRR